MTRLRAIVVQQVLIVAGICLPILILLGLKGGQVEALRHQLLTSPTGREIVLWPRPGESLTAHTLAELRIALPAIDLAIPDLNRTAALSRVLPSGDRCQAADITFRATLPGDPFLAQFKYELDDDELGVVLTAAVADTLKAHAGDTVTLTIERSRGPGLEEATCALRIKHIAVERLDSNAVCYLHARLLDQIGQFVLGARVPERNWPATREFARDDYPEYLVFSRAQQDLDPSDLKVFKGYSLTIEKIDEDSERSLFGLLNAARMDDLIVYRLYGVRSRTDPRQRLFIPRPSELTRKMRNGAVVIAWHPPIIEDFAGTTYRLVGCSIPEFSWLENFFWNKSCFFQDGIKKLEMRVREGSTLATASTVSLPLSERESVPLAVQVLDLASEPAPGTESTGAPPAHSELESSVSDSNLQGEEQSLSEKAATEVSDPSRAQQAIDSDSALSAVESHRVTPDPPELGSDLNESVDDATAPAGTAVTPARTLNPEAIAHEPELSVVPVALLSYLSGFKSATVDYDPITHIFVPLPAANVYPRVRLYARTVDEVLPIVDSLSQRGYSKQDSADSQIKEIQEEASALQLLVVIVAASVFIFGVITVFGVLHDATERMRGTIGILRVMGVSRAGVFSIVLGRALIIGVIAAGFSVVCSILASAILARFGISSVMEWRGLLFVLCGAMMCCLFGALIPGWLAARLDPFETVVQGKVR